MGQKKILIEGWRGINHSYSLVNQNQLLVLMNMGFDLSHHDLPFYNSNWNSKDNDAGFDPGTKDKLLTIKVADLTHIFDTTYRISFPFRFYPSNSEKLFVFGTAEFQTINGFVYENAIRAGIENLNLKIITPSEWSKVGFVKAGFDESRVIVVPHGVNRYTYKRLSPDQRLEFRNALNMNTNDFMILCLGAMTHNKGIDVLLKAYAILKKRYPHIKLILKDSRNLYGVRAQDMVMRYFENSKTLKDELLNSILFIPNNLTQYQLNGLYAAADCYASPYRAEGFNLTPLEAAASGTPIIITKGGSTDDYFHPSFALQIDSKIVREAENTYIEPNLESLTEQLTILIDNKPTSLNKDAAEEIINQNFTWPVVVKKLSSYF